MSQEGYDKLVAELRQLENVELPRVREAIAEARDKGDLSENFEYHPLQTKSTGVCKSYRYPKVRCRCCWTAHQGRDDQSEQQHQNGI